MSAGNGRQVNEADKRARIIAALEQLTERLREPGDDAWAETMKAESDVSICEVHIELSAREDVLALLLLGERPRCRRGVDDAIETDAAGWRALNAAAQARGVTRSDVVSLVCRHLLDWHRRDAEGVQRWAKGRKAAGARGSWGKATHTLRVDVRDVCRIPSVKAADEFAQLAYAIGDPEVMAAATARKPQPARRRARVAA